KEGRGRAPSSRDQRVAGRATQTAPARSVTRHGSTATSICVIFFGLANVMLGVELEPELGDEIELGLEIIDMLFLVVHELLEQVARHVVLDGVAVRCGFLVKGARRHLRRKIAVEHFPHVLSDAKRIEHLHVGKAVEEDDARDDIVGVLHLLDRFLAPFLRQVPVTPIVQGPVMQPVLVDGGKLVPQTAVEILDNPCVALHVPDLRLKAVAIAGCRARVSRKDGRDKGSSPANAGPFTRRAGLPGNRHRPLPGGLIDNAADRARATAALGAAAEAAIDLARGARCLAAIERRADVLIAQHVARTDDHGDQGSWAVVSSLCNYRYMRPRRQAKTKRRFFSYSNVRLARARDRRASSRFSQAAATG